MQFELVPNADLDVSVPVTAQKPDLEALNSSDQQPQYAATNKNGDGPRQSASGTTGQRRTSKEQLTQEEREDVLSQFSFSELDRMEKEQADKSISELIDLTVPITYRVKFNFTPEKVMMRISKDRLRRLNKVWEQSSDGLTLLEFTKLMILEVPSVKEEKLEMINALIRLFRQVDINGDEKMEWSEFVQYMIDQVKTESIVATKDMQGNNVTIADKIRMQQAGRFHKIKRSGRPMDKGRHKHTMLDVIKCVDTKNKAKTVIMHSEENSTTVQWYGLNFKPICSMQVPVKEKTAKVLSIAHQDVSKSLYAFGPQGTDAVYGVLCSDHILYFYIRNRGRIELFFQIETGEIMQTKVWFMPKHKAWLTAGKDFKIRQWNISPIAQKHEMGDPVQLHSDLITDCTEIMSPFCVATCSLDRTIVLYDVKAREALRRFDRKHVTGIRNLRYMRNFGGMIISTGFEIYANVWGPQNLFGNAHLGRLKGHKNPICAVDVIQERPFVFTLDNTNEIIVWDIRNFTPLQIVPAPNPKEARSHGLLAMRPDLLWVYGQRFIIYDRQELFDENEVEIPDTEEMQMPISAFHNKFFSTICVQTPQDLKIYSCLDGQLMVMHQSVFKHGHVNCNHILQDKRHRKAYLASNDGRINVIDVQSGVTLKQCFEDEDTQNALEKKNKQLAKQVLAKAAGSPRKKQAAQTSPRPKSSEELAPGRKAAFLTETEAPNQDTVSEMHQKPKETGPAVDDQNATELDDDLLQMDQQRQIVDMILVWEKQMNQLIYADKKGYYVYNESDEKKSEQLRSVTGAHKSSITAIQFSYYLSLIATGTENGEVAVWDYELSQLMGICQGHSQSRGEITAIEFMQPYPVMATAGLDSKIILWAVRPAPQERCYVAIGMYNNISFNYTDDAKIPIRSFKCYSGESIKGFSRGQCMKHSQINAETYRDYKTNQVLAIKEASVRIDSQGQYRGLSQIKDIRLNMLKEQLKPATGEADAQTKIEETFDSMRLPYLARMENMDPEYDARVDEEKLRVYLYLGDDFGILKLWDLTYVLDQAQLQPCKAVWETRGDQYFPNRTEMVNVTGYASRLRNIAQQNKLTRLRIQDPEDSGLIIRECVAHDRSITKINEHELGGLITVSKDCQVRIWSHGLDLWGIINCKHYEQDVLWYFPMREQRQQEDIAILQMQELTNQLREEDEQAVLFERDSDLDDDEEHFTSKATYKKFKSNVLEKKRSKEQADRAEENAIIEERREWNNALAMSKAKPQPALKEFLPFNKNLRAIERIEELIDKEKKLEARILYEQEHVEVKGEVVAETSKRLDKLIQKALKKHERYPAGGGPGDSGQMPSLSSRKLPGSKLSKNSISMVMRRSRQVSNAGRSEHVSDSSSNQSLSSPKKFSPTKVVKRIKSKLSSLSPSLSPEKRTATEKITSVHEAASALIKMQKVGGSSRKQLVKNQAGSNLSLLLDSSCEGSNKKDSSANVISAVQNKNIIAPIPEEKPGGINEKEDGDDSSSMKEQIRHVVESNRRPLDELNMTKTLIKKVEATKEQQSVMKQFVNDKEYVEDAADDRQHLLKCKNLPSIREQLFSIKSKQQKAHLDPKYNRKVMNNLSQAGQPGPAAATISSPYSNMNEKSTAALAIRAPADQSVMSHQNQSRMSPFARQSGHIKSHQQAMNELSVIARDLETYNKNRNFDQRARSMLIQQGSMAARERNLRSLEPASAAASQLKVGYEVDISQQSVSIQGRREDDATDFVKQRSNSLMTKQVHGGGLDLGNQAAGATATDEESIQRQLREFQSQLMARDSKRHEKIRIRNMANSRTPINYRRNMSRLKHEQLEGKPLQNSNSVSRIIPPPNLNAIELPQSIMIYGDQEIQQNSFDLKRHQALMQQSKGPQISVDNRNAAIALSPGRFDISLDLLGSNSRNAIHNHINTDVLQQHNRPEMRINEEENSTMSFVKDTSTSQLSAAFKRKLLQNHRSNNGNNDAQTAAHSISIEKTLAHDASRQYIDVNFSIGEHSTVKNSSVKNGFGGGAGPNAYGKQAQYHHELSQVLPRNNSLSQVTASLANYSDTQKLIGEPASSLYGAGPGLAANKKISAGRSSLPVNAMAGGSSALRKLTNNSANLFEAAASSKTIGRRPNNHLHAGQSPSVKNWKEQRRTSEQMRMNDVTGRFEQVDLLEVKKNQYLALKQKYAGKDSGIASLVRREAENIQKQRERISELKDFKTMMRTLKQTSTTSAIAASNANTTTAAVAAKQLAQHQPATIAAPSTTNEAPPAGEAVSTIQTNQYPSTQLLL